MGMETKIQNNQLMEVAEAADLIRAGKTLVVSGEESLLFQLPRGNWIGGTIPYFYLSGEKGRMDKTKVFVSDFTSLTDGCKIANLTKSNIQDVCKDGYDNGFDFVILPAGQDILATFALNSPDYERQYINPLFGLVAGVDIDELSKGRLSKTFNGTTGQSSHDGGVVLHCSLPAKKVARVEIINVFEPSNDIFIEVENDSFTVGNCLINGKHANLYDYIKGREFDISYPLVCDYAGATVNVSFLKLDDEKREVQFYAPLFKNRKYTTAKKFDSYSHLFKQRVITAMNKERNVVYNCNCILNFIYGELTKNDIGFSGTVTFGEIAYHLLNQTFSYLAIDEE